MIANNSKIGHCGGMDNCSVDINDNQFGDAAVISVGPVAMDSVNRANDNLLSSTCSKDFSSTKVNTNNDRFLPSYQHNNRNRLEKQQRQGQDLNTTGSNAQYNKSKGNFQAGRTSRFYQNSNRNEQFSSGSRVFTKAISSVMGNTAAALSVHKRPNISTGLTVTLPDVSVPPPSLPASAADKRYKYTVTN